MDTNIIVYTLTVAYVSERAPVVFRKLQMSRSFTAVAAISTLLPTHHFTQNLFAFDARSHDEGVRWCGGGVHSVWGVGAWRGR